MKKHTALFTRGDLQSLWLYFALTGVLGIFKQTLFPQWSWWLVTFPLWIIGALMLLAFIIRFIAILVTYRKRNT